MTLPAKPVNLLLPNEASCEAAIAAGEWPIPLYCTRAGSAAAGGSHGNSALELTSTGSGFVLYCGSSTIGGIQAGKTYSAIARVKSGAVARSAQVEINWYGPAGYLGPSTGAAVPFTSGEWTWLSTTGAAPAGCDTAVLYVVVPTGAVVPAGEKYYFDQISFHAGSSTEFTPPRAPTGRKVTDSFDRANGAAEIAESSQRWINRNVNPLNIVSSKAQKIAGESVVDISTAGELAVDGTVSFVVSGAGVGGCVIRGASLTSYYGISVQPGVANGSTFLKNVGSIGGMGTTTTINAGDRVKAVVSGSSFKGYVNDVLAFEATDSAITAPGWWGTYQYTTDFIIDNFLFEPALPAPSSTEFTPPRAPTGRKVTDSFDRANGAAEIAESSQRWINRNVNPLNIVSSKAQKIAGESVVDISTAGELAVDGTVSFVVSGAGVGGCVIRGASLTSYYGISVQPGVANGSTFLKNVGSIGGMGTTTTINAGDRVKAVVSGSSFKGYVNDVLAFEATDSAITAPGWWGTYQYTTDFIIDNFLFEPALPAPVR